MREILLVATSGGHVDELYDFDLRIGRSEHPRRWVTARTAQTESLLAGRTVDWVPAVASREGVKALRSLPRAIGMMRRTRPSAVVSTGAALAIPYLLAARLTRIETHFIESATRLTRPSLTGRIARRIPGVRLYHQGSNWTEPKWHDAGSVFDGYEVTTRPASNASDSRPPRVVVTLGSERFPFERARDACAEALSSVPLVRWQLGNTASRPDLPGSVSDWVPYAELMDEMAASDVVVCHAGVGSVLSVLRTGRCPVVVPRLAGFGEHIDDHQLELARFLHEREIAVLVDDTTDVAAAIHTARQRQVVRRAPDQLPPLLS